MRELDRLVSCLEDAQRILAMESEEDLRELFRSSRTNIAQAFDNGVDGLLSQWPDDAQRLESIKAYLLWDYVACNMTELYNSYDLSRDVLKEGLERER